MSGSDVGTSRVKPDSMFIYVSVHGSRFAAGLMGSVGRTFRANTITLVCVLEARAELMRLIAELGLPPS